MMAASESYAPFIRRWYLLLGGLVVTLGIAAGAAVSVPVTYEAQATVLLVPGRGSIPEAGNPFLYLGGLGQARDVVVQTLKAEATRALVQGERAYADYSVGGDPTSSAPIITVVASGSSVSGVQETRTAVLTLLPQIASDIQARASAPENARFTSLVIADDAPVTANKKAQVRMIVAALVLGALMTLLATAGVDLVLRSKPMAGRRSATGRPRRDEPRRRQDQDAPAQGGEVLGDDDDRAPADSRDNVGSLPGEQVGAGLRGS